MQKTSKRATIARLKKAITRAKEQGKLAEAANFQSQLDQVQAKKK